MKNQIILIYGWPASGKLTMAKRLQVNGGVLLDNHYFHDFVRPFIEVPDLKQGQYFKEIGELRTCFFDVLRQFYPKQKFVQYVFTCVIAQGDEQELANLEQLAYDIKADFIPIELLADKKTLKTRINTESRRARGKIISGKQLDNMMRNYQPLNFNHPNKLTIDTSYLNENETFKLIQKHLARFGR